MQESTLIIAKGATVVWTVPPNLSGSQMGAPLGGAVVRQGLLEGWVDPVFPVLLTAGDRLQISAPEADGQVPVAIPDGPSPLDLVGATPPGGLITDVYGGHTLLRIDGPSVTAEHSADGSMWATLTPPAYVPPGQLRLTRLDSSGWLSRLTFALGGTPTLPGDGGPGTPPEAINLVNGVPVSVPAQQSTYAEFLVEEAGTATVRMTGFTPAGFGWLSLTRAGEVAALAEASIDADPTQISAQLEPGRYAAQVYLESPYPFTLQADWGKSSGEPPVPEVPAERLLLNGEAKSVDFGVGTGAEYFIDLATPSIVTLNATTTFTGSIPWLTVELYEKTAEGSERRAGGNVHEGPVALMYTLPAGRHIIRAERLDSQADLSLVASWVPKPAVLLDQAVHLEPGQKLPVYIDQLQGEGGRYWLFLEGHLAEQFEVSWSDGYGEWVLTVGAGPTYIQVDIPENATLFFKNLSADTAQDISARIEELPDLLPLVSGRTVLLDLPAASKSSSPSYSTAGTRTFDDITVGMDTLLQLRVEGENTIGTEVLMVYPAYLQKSSLRLTADSNPWTPQLELLSGSSRVIFFNPHEVPVRLKITPSW